MDSTIAVMHLAFCSLTLITERYWTIVPTGQHKTGSAERYDEKKAARRAPGGFLTTLNY
jgi:hypothetical protein